MRPGRAPVLASLIACFACSATPASQPEPPPPSAPAVAQAPSAGEATAARAASSATPAPAAVPTAPVPTDPVPTAPGPTELTLDRHQLELPAGHHEVPIYAEAHRYVSVGVAGPRKALRALKLKGEGQLAELTSEVLHPDGLLPAFVSFETGDAAETVTLSIDVDAPVRVLRAQVSVDDITPRDAKALKLGSAEARPLIGIPFPLDRREGYAMEHPHRYQFSRVDVVAALRAAFAQTRIRFKRNVLAIADASQWDGERPAADLGKPRHISHRGGRDVDIALPVKHGLVSRIERRCEGVLVEQQELRCGPGTIKDVDGLRLAYFLGLLIDGPTPQGRHEPNPRKRPGPIADVETIFTDQVYIDEIKKALEVLRDRRWIHEDAYGALGEDGLLRPSPWHTDHVHIRFRGESAAVPEVLRFAADPPETDAGARVVGGQQ